MLFGPPTSIRPSDLAPPQLQTSCRWPIQIACPYCQSLDHQLRRQQT